MFRAIFCTSSGA